MGVIVKELEVISIQGKRRCKVVFDSGASRTLIRKDIAEQFCYIWPLPHEVTLAQADGQSGLRATHLTFIDFIIEGYHVPARHPRSSRAGKLL